MDYLIGRVTFWSIAMKLGGRWQGFTRPAWSNRLACRISLSSTWKILKGNVKSCRRWTKSSGTRNVTMKASANIARKTRFWFKRIPRSALLLTLPYATIQQSWPLPRNLIDHLNKFCSVSLPKKELQSFPKQDRRNTSRRTSTWTSQYPMTSCKCWIISSMTSESIGTRTELFELISKILLKIHDHGNKI